MYRMDGRVAFSDINERGYLSIVGILDYLQDCCTFHSEDVGYPVERLKEEHRGWFVTSWQIKVHDLPKHGERIAVLTMPTQVRGMIGERYFLIQDAEGTHTYIEVKSLWVFMDTAQYKPTRAPEGMAEAFCLDEAPEGTWGPRKIALGENAKEVYTFTVANWQLDTNHHMNNKRYVEQAVTLLPPDFRIGGMRIEYKKQATLGDVVHVKQVELENGIQVWLCDDADDLYFIMDFYRNDEE
ncbi:MAG: acyl-[Lachnospiraceae bacterium]|nr:acyl-[acyl-carrier-protein] thioesterase [Lachnospiraceae bacterium]MBQ2504193.1 acyl-[acyl-carrier-protein] thioesterase [Lachnospiraceae bacterium]MBQ5387311.1 acyl-[acyl-carrier-protein] thioesterase [Lachnospiraceae bacterium]